MQRISRRQALIDSMWAAALGTAAVSLPGRAGRAAESSSPNERLGVAVCGVRSRGQAHIKGYLGRDDVEILYVCDPDESFGNQRADQIAEKQGRRPKWVADQRELLDDGAVDIVSIATPNHWHALGAIWALQAGKDVYVEKPVSHNVSEGRRIVQAARKYNRMCQCGTQCRSNPAVIDAMKYIHDGNIGTVKVARGLCYKRRKSIGEAGKYEAPANVNYNLWLGPAPEAPVTRPQFHYDWHWQWPYGNGDLGNQGIHQMDIARWGLGREGLSERVLSYGGRFGYDDAGQTANTQVCIFDYGDSTLVFEVRGLETSKYRGADVGVIFEGTDGYVVQATYGRCLAFDADGNQVKEFTGGDDRNHFDNFLAGVRNRDRATLNGEILEGHLSSALCHLGNISYLLGEDVQASELQLRIGGVDWSADEDRQTLKRTLEHLEENGVRPASQPITLGKSLQFDPKTETFVGNDDANALLTREYRKPFVVPSEENV